MEKDFQVLNLTPGGNLNNQGPRHGCGRLSHQGSQEWMNSTSTVETVGREGQGKGRRHEGARQKDKGAIGGHLDSQFGEVGVS